jgi:hypothetical protein
LHLAALEGCELHRPGDFHKVGVGHDTVLQLNMLDLSFLLATTAGSGHLLDLGCWYTNILVNISDMPDLLPPK